MVVSAHSGCDDFNDLQGFPANDCGAERQTVNRCSRPFRRYEDSEAGVPIVIFRAPEECLTNWVNPANFVFDSVFDNVSYTCN